jgi:hypothetical protein
MGERGMAVILTRHRRVCSECVEDQFLRAKIEKEGQSGICFYCELNGKTFSIDQPADLVKIALSELFELTTANPLDHKESGYLAGQRVADVINDAGIWYVATEDILKVLAERLGQDENYAEQGAFDENARYSKRRSVNDWDFEDHWLDFESSLKTEARYFNRLAGEHLASIFEGIGEHKTKTGRPIVVEAGPGKELAVLYRARVFQEMAKFEEAMKRPDRDVGPPPPSAAIAGRMNAAGISVFYGATDPGVALAEVRPPVGSKVLVAGFEVIQPLRLLDLTALDLVADEKGSIFDTDYIQRLKRAEFLRGLSERISKPAMPDNQPRDYLPTQAIADYLATATNPPLDGIIYPSVQAGHSHPIFGNREGKRNVVLFHKVARVQALEIPEGADVSVNDDSLLGLPFLDDRPEAKYTVFEKVVSAIPLVDPVDEDDAPLRFSSLEVHHVRGVRIDSISSQVQRYRSEKGGPDEAASSSSI